MEDILEYEVIGSDLGNDSVKIAFGAQKHCVIKNTVSRRMMTDKRKNLSMDGEGTDEERQLSNLDVIIRPTNGQEERYYIGDLAISAGEDETVVGTEKADNPYIHIPLLAVLAFHTPRTKKEARYKLVCGLPIKQFNPSTRAKMQERLTNEFDVTLMEPDGTRGRKVRIVIQEVTVAPEGVPVIFNQMLNQEATDILRPELRKGSYGVIDIGAFTTDIPVLVDGKPDSLASEGIDEGISTYLDRIAKTLSEGTRSNITRNQLIKRIIDNDLVMSIRGKEYDLQKEIEDQLTLFAKKIVDVTDRLWSKNYEIKEFIVVGGGGKLLRPYLNRIMAQRELALSFVEKKNKRDYQNDPQLQNAYGYWKIAKQRYGA